MSVLTGMSFWTFLRGNFEENITLSLFDAFKLFYLLMLTCEITVIHLLLLDLEKILLTCFFHVGVYPISIHPYNVK